MISTGTIRHEELRKYFNLADVYVTSSLHEGFCIPVVEAMACGTPVLGFRCGSVPEIIDEGVTGVIVDTVDQAILALPRLIALDRQKVRARFEQRFSAARMARDYVKIYGELLASAKTTEDAGIRHLMREQKNEKRDRARIV